MDEPLISIVIPCYNAGRTLQRTVLSVMSQDYRNFEVILVDDGSTDQSLLLADEFKKQDNRFRLYRQAHKGVSAARNMGLERARSEWIAFLDADDILFENSITARLQALLQANEPALLGAYCPALLIDPEGNVLIGNPLFDYPLPGNRLYFSSTPDCVFNPSTLIAKKSELLNAGGFNEALDFAEDYELWHRMMRGGGYFLKVDVCAVGWTQHPESAAHSRIQRHYDAYQRVLQGICSEAGDEIPAEYRGGYGKVSFALSRTKKAFSFCMLALATGQIEIAESIAPDISKQMLEELWPSELEYFVKFNVLRATCTPETEWRRTVWPKVRVDILRFLIDLSQRLGGNCHSLLVLLRRLSAI